MPDKITANVSGSRVPAFRRGFVLYIVMAVLLALAIMAFALNTFKQGAVTQLARNVDQNRLALLAQSANAEVVAMIRSQVNGDASSKIFEKFRGVFPGFSPAQSINSDIVLFSGFEPEQTLQMAQSAGYPLKIRSKAVLRVYRQCEFASVSAFNAYLDVFSQAYRDGNEDNVIEVHERRDVRLVDIRHTLDKYVLFVKNYSPDYNNTTRRIIVQGITPSGPHMSRVYLGNDNYPTCLDEQKNIWLDLNYAEHKNAPGFAALFNFSKLTDFPGSDASDTLFMKASVPFKELKDSKNNYLSEAYVSSFVNVPAVKKIYVKFVNDAADGCNGQVTPAKVGTELKTKCSQAMPKSNSNAASYQICDDYVKKSKDTDYSACTGFQKILRTCMEEWKLHYGYLDAANVWQIENIERPALPPAKSWVTALAFKGLTYLADENAKKGPYFYAYLNKLPDTQDGAAGKVYNPERLRVGKMLQLYGEANDTPVAVEGPVFLRFFKLAFFDTFEKEITFFEKQRKVIPEPVPIPFIRPLLDPGTFQNLALANNFSPTPYFSDSMMMSRAIDNVSVNALLGDTLEYYSWDGKPVTINPLTADRPTFAYPRQKPSASPVKAKNFGRLIDFKTVSYNYSSPGEFLAERTSGSAPDKTLFIDGAMYIEAGDLDLTEVSKFYGKGLIYLGKGNCFMGNLARVRDASTGDSLRIYLRQGDYILKKSTSLTIEASLAALTYPPGSADPAEQGSLIFNGQDSVTIIGNLLVDYLYTQEKGDNSLKVDGFLKIRHDPGIYEAGADLGDGPMDPYHVSIGSVKTIFSLNSGGKTF